MNNDILMQEQETMHSVCVHLKSLIETFLSFSEDKKQKDAAYFAMSIIPVITTVACCAVTFSRYQLAEQLEEFAVGFYENQGVQWNDLPLRTLEELTCFLEDICHQYSQLNRSENTFTH